MSDKVEYELSLKDLFSETVDKVHEKAKKFGEVLDGVKQTVEKLGEKTPLSGTFPEQIKQAAEVTQSFGDVIGKITGKVDESGHNPAFAKMSEKLLKASESAEKFGKTLDKVKAGAEKLGLDASFLSPVEYIKGGIEKVKQLNEAHESLADAMKNSGSFSQDAYNKMTAGAAEFAEHVKFNEEDIVSMQAKLATVGNIGAEQMGKLTQAGADVATKLNISLAEAGEELKNAMKDPASAGGLGEKLKIDPAVMTDIQKLAGEGHNAEAQMKLLDAVQQKVGGSAKKAFDSSPAAWFNKTVGDVQKHLGDFANAAHVAELATKAQAIWTNTSAIYEKVRAGGLDLLTDAQVALNEAMDANPIGVIIVGLAAVGAVIYMAYEKSEVFRGAISSLWGMLKTFGNIVKDIFTGLYHVIHGVFKLNPAEISSGLDQIETTVGNAAQKLGAAAKDGYEKGVKDKEDEDKNGAATTGAGTVAGNEGKTDTGNNTGGKQGGNNSTAPPPPQSSGPRSVTINISINKQIETLNIKTSNLVESAAKIQEHVAEALTNAVNQSQVTAGGR